MSDTKQLTSRCSCFTPDRSQSRPIARPSSTMRPEAAGRRRAILVPIDRSFHPALSAAIALASATGAHLVVLHVTMSPMSMTNGGAGGAEFPHEDSGHVLAAAAAMMPGNVHAEYYECQGDPAAEIVQFASQWAPEMIVMGLRPEGPSDVFPGCKVLGNVLRQTRCPVLLVRYPEPDATRCV